MDQRRPTLSKIIADAIGYATDNIKESATRWEYNSPQHEDEVRKKCDMVDDMRDRLLSMKETLYDIYRIPSNSQHRLWKRSKRGAKENKLGNCEEMADLVLHYLRKFNVPAEKFAIEGGNHCVVVIDRNLKSDPNDPSEWGEKTIICDAVFKEFYPVSQIKEKLKYLSDEQIYNVYYPVFENKKSESSKANTKIDRENSEVEEIENESDEENSEVEEMEEESEDKEELTLKPFFLLQ